MIGRFNKHCFSMLAAFVFALLAFTVFPAAANAHGVQNTTSKFTEKASYVDVSHVKKPSYANSHCHSDFGQDCSTQIAFLITSVALSTDTDFDVVIPIYNTSSTGWALSFDPPPPRVLS